MCEFCSNLFNSHLTLTRHCLSEHGESVNSKQKIYECPQPYCNKRYFDKRNYQGHINKHAEIRPHGCTKCKADFVYKQNADRHQALCLGKTKAYECLQCDNVFRSPNALKDHITGRHGGKCLHCVCGKAYAWRQCLTRHKKTCKIYLANKKF